MITDEIDRSSSVQYKMNNVNLWNSLLYYSDTIIVSQNEILGIIIKHIFVIKYFPQWSGNQKKYLENLYF